jgi:hypothetical protein
MGRKNHTSTKPQGHKTAKHKRGTKAVSLPSGRVVRVSMDKPHVKVGETLEAYQVRLNAWRASRGEQ